MLSEEELYVLAKLGVHVCILMRKDEQFEQDQFFWVQQSAWEKDSMQILHISPLYVTQETCDKFSAIYDSVFQKNTFIN